jgi:hypothetical protein
LIQIAHIPWPAVLDDRVLQENVTRADGGLSSELIAQLTGRKQQVLAHLRAQLQTVYAILLGKLPSFNALMLEWTQHCEESSWMSETEKTFSFAQRHLALLDGIDTFIVNQLAVQKLGKLMRNWSGATIDNVVEMTSPAVPAVPFWHTMLLDFTWEFLRNRHTFTVLKNI